MSKANRMFGKLLHQRGRPRTAPAQSWRKEVIARGFKDVPDGTLCDITPAPGNTYTKYDWPPRGRGRGEALDSPRRIQAKLRAAKVLQLYGQGFTFQEIARMTGFKDASGPYRAMKRAMDRVNWDRDQEARNRAYL